jgi:pimeloyl-ACP methyl ester carboxylesterase
MGQTQLTSVVCVPGFAGGATTWRPLVEALAPFDVTVVDLPGFGGCAPTGEPATVTGFAAVVERSAPRVPAVLVAHSLGSPIAVEAAGRLGARCRGLVSIEGNLTPEDAYFSGQAADHDDPVAFQHALASQVDTLVAGGRAPASYADAIRAADARTMWALSRDARTRDFGPAYRALPNHHLPLTHTGLRSPPPPSSPPRSPPSSRH